MGFRMQEKPRLWLGVRGGAEGTQETFAEEASAPKQFGARRLVPLPDKESPAEAGLQAIKTQCRDLQQDQAIF
jgi:hypothetical protein